MARTNPLANEGALLVVKSVANMGADAIFHARYKMYTTAIVVNTVTNVGMASTRVVMPVATSIRTPMVPGTIPIKYCSPLRNPNLSQLPPD